MPLRCAYKRTHHRVEFSFNLFQVDIYEKEEFQMLNEQTIEALTVEKRKSVYLNENGENEMTIETKIRFHVCRETFKSNVEIH